jgi:hypothetical protein
MDPRTPLRRSTISDGAAAAPAAAAAVGAGPGACVAAMAADAWNVEASALVQELTATQREVADMLLGQTSAQQELDSLKGACTSEVGGRARVCSAGLLQRLWQPS